MERKAAIRQYQSKVKKRLKKQNISNWSVDQLLEKIQQEVDGFNYESAKIYSDEALKRFPDNLKVLDISATLCLEMQDYDSARKYLGIAITLDPDAGYGRYFSFAQLLTGDSALESYKRGIEVIERLIKANSPVTKSNGEILGTCVKQEANLESSVAGSSKNGSGSMNGEQNMEVDSDQPSGKAGVDKDSSNVSKISEAKSLRRELSNAYLSIVELFTTELCDEENAEQQCLHFIKMAMDSDLSNPEAYYHQANYHLIKENLEEAKEAILKSVSLWLPIYLSVDDGEAEAGSFDPVEVCPLSEDFRIQTAKLLIEVKELDSAGDVLECLLGEDDENVEVWYLMGWNLHINGDDTLKSNAKFHLKKALEIHKSVKWPDKEIVNHIKELLEELKDVHSEPEQSDDELELNGDIEENSEDKMEGVS